jgi:hypothetical protein
MPPLPPDGPLHVGPAPLQTFHLDAVQTLVWRPSLEMRPLPDQFRQFPPPQRTLRPPRRRRVVRLTSRAAKKKMVPSDPRKLPAAGLLANPSPCGVGGLDLTPRAWGDPWPSLAADRLSHADRSTLQPNTPVAQHAARPELDSAAFHSSAPRPPLPASRGGLNAPGLQHRFSFRRPLTRSVLPSTAAPSRSAPRPQQVKPVVNRLHENLSGLTSPPLPLGVSPFRVPPSGSKCSAKPAIRWSSTPAARSPFAPPSFPAFAVHSRIIVPGPLRPVWTAVPQTSWNHL